MMPGFQEDSLDMPLRDVIARMQQRVMSGSTYFGVPTHKSPTDAWVYQEIVFEQQPDWIVEIGTKYGGSALMFAHWCDLIGHGNVVSVDLSQSRAHPLVRAHPRITLIEADGPCAVAEVRDLVGSETALVIDDSAHTYDTTLAVLHAYAPLVPVGGYFIVEDTNCHHGLDRGPSPGAYEAVEEFLRTTDGFRVDRDREAYLITWNPHGYLVRVDPPAAEPAG